MDFPSVDTGERDEWPLPDHIEEWNEWWLNNTYDRVIGELARDYGTTPEDLDHFAHEVVGFPRAA